MYVIQIVHLLFHSSQDAAIETYLRELKGGAMAVALLRTSKGPTPARLDKTLQDLGLTSAKSYDCYETFEGMYFRGTDFFGSLHYNIDNICTCRSHQIKSSMAKTQRILRLASLLTASNSVIVTSFLSRA